MSFLGPSEEAVDFYHRLIKSGEGLEADSRLAQPSPPPVESKRWGTKQVEILSVQFVNENGEPKEVFQTGEYFEARISYVSRLEKEKPVFGVAIRTIYKLLIYGPNTLDAGLSEEIAPEGVVRFVIPRLPLLEGDYLFSTAVYDESLMTSYDHHEMMYHFQVPGSSGRDFGSVRIHSEWKIEGK
jgi:hypothetical protein